MTGVLRPDTQFTYLLTSFGKVVGLGELIVGPPDGEMSGVLREECARSRSILGVKWVSKAFKGPGIAALWIATQLQTNWGLEQTRWEIMQTQSTRLYGNVTCTHVIETPSGSGTTNWIRLQLKWIDCHPFSEIVVWQRETRNSLTSVRGIDWNPIFILCISCQVSNCQWNANVSTWLAADNCSEWQLLPSSLIWPKAKVPGRSR